MSGGSVERSLERRQAGGGGGVLDRHGEADADEGARRLGLRMAVTMPTTSPSMVTSGPPELPGLAAASNWIRLRQLLLAFGRAELALQARHHAARKPRGRCRTESRRRSPRRRAPGRRWSASSRRSGRRGSCCACSTARSFSGCTPTMTASDSRPSEKVTLMRFGAGHHVQVGQDHALVDDDHAGADAALDLAALLVVAAVVVLGHQADHAHDRGRDHLVGLGRRRGQRLVLQRLAHRRVDVLLRQRRAPSRRAGLPTSRRRAPGTARRQRPDHALVAAAAGPSPAAPGGRPAAAAGAAAPRRGRAPRGARGAARTAVERRFFRRHPATCGAARRGPQLCVR